MRSQTPSATAAEAMAGSSMRPAQMTGTSTASLTILAKGRYIPFSTYMGGWFHHQAS